MGNTTGSCCGGHATDDTPTQKLALTTSPAQADDAIAQCPVMAGTPVDTAAAEAAGLFRDYQGQRYWFCCAGCGPAFDADPAKYAHAG
ncbi:YHS domain-containing protein [Kocuria nitroreducens]|uniref:YHS domain-containing protein n=1 Tax=Kocuria nitroreducens TaxID=3058914 RepID=UPI0036DB4225